MWVLSDIKACMSGCRRHWPEVNRLLCNCSNIIYLRLFSTPIRSLTSKPCPAVVPTFRCKTALLFTIPAVHASLQALSSAVICLWVSRAGYCGSSAKDSSLSAGDPAVNNGMCVRTKGIRSQAQASVCATADSSSAASEQLLAPPGGACARIIIADNIANATRTSPTDTPATGHAIASHPVTGSRQCSHAGGS